MSDVFIAEQDGSGFYPCADDVFDARYEPAVAADAQRKAVARTLVALRGTAAVEAPPTLPEPMEVS